MSTCRHAHHQQTTADIWTKLAAAGEGTASLISDAYWIGGLIDLAAQLDDDGYGLSWYGMGFGTALALVTAAGSAYSHTMLNLNHQREEITHDHICKTDQQITETDHLITNDEDEEHSHDQDEEHHHDHDHSHDHDGKLTWLQYAALAGDYISHIGDIAGPITFIADIAAKDRLPLWGKALVQCGATLFGGISSVANVRSCKNSIEELNKNQAEHHHRSFSNV